MRLSRSLALAALALACVSGVRGQSPDAPVSFPVAELLAPIIFPPYKSGEQSSASSTISGMTRRSPTASSSLEESGQSQGTQEVDPTSLTFSPDGTLAAGGLCPWEKERTYAIALLDPVTGKHRGYFHLD